MKKIILIFSILIALIACEKKDSYVLHYFYNSTCGECQLIKEDFINALDNRIEVISYDMDETRNLIKYQECLDQLMNIDLNLYQEPLTPFIYMEDGFGAVGYIKDLKSVYLKLVEETIKNQPYSLIPSGVWVSK